MTRYSSERKEAIMKKLLPPQNMTVAEVARQEGISPQTLYNWRDQAKNSGLPVPGKTSTSEQWSAETKLAVIVETATLSESELGEYCRAKGLFIEQIKRWKDDCLAGFQNSKTQEKATLKQARTDQHEIKKLKKDLNMKNVALAETAALLVLRKKLNAFWGEGSEDQ
jgi:transposase-like protein